MAPLIEEKSTSEHLRDYALKLTDGDRVRIEVNGETITYIRLADGDLFHSIERKLW